MKCGLVFCFLSLTTSLFGQNVRVGVSSNFKIDSVELNNKKVFFLQISDSTISFNTNSSEVFNGVELALFSNKRIYTTLLSLEKNVNLNNLTTNELQLNFKTRSFVSSRLNGNSTFFALPLITYSLKKRKVLMKESYGIHVTRRNRT